MIPAWLGYKADHSSRGLQPHRGCHARRSAAWRPAVRQASGSGDPDAAEFRRAGRGGTRFLEENGFLKETQMRLGAASDSTGGGGGNQMTSVLY